MNAVQESGDRQLKPSKLIFGPMATTFVGVPSRPLLCGRRSSGMHRTLGRRRVTAGTYMYIHMYMHPFTTFYPIYTYYTIDILTIQFNIKQYSCDIFGTNST